MYACFVNSEEKPVSVKHICWYATKVQDSDGMFLQLCEVVEETYKHPDAPDDAFVKKIDVYCRTRVKEVNADIEKLILSLQATCSKIHEPTTSVK